jgi:hypothetical protein
MILQIAEKWVSKNHCRIICRKNPDYPDYQYFLEDFSRFGTFIYQDGHWKQVHNQEVPLESGFTDSLRQLPRPNPRICGRIIRVG